MSFSYDTKNELCRLPVQKLCCARAEAYGILLFCNTFSATEVRIITENPHFAARLPKLFRRAFNLQFDRQPEPEQETEKPHAQEPFTPVLPARRRPGTGYVKQLNDHLWEGRYSPVWPDGKKHSRNVYGHTEAECEEKLAELILQMKAEIAALRSGASTEYPDGVSPKKKAIAAYLREHPGVTNKAKIARDLNMDRTTVQRYYDEIRVELRGEESPALQM